MLVSVRVGVFVLFCFVLFCFPGMYPRLCVVRLLPLYREGIPPVGDAGVPFSLFIYFTSHSV